MTHLEVENLVSDYLERQLKAARREEVEEHLAGCSQCQELVSDVRRIMERCQSAEDLEPAPWLISRILLATIGERQPTLAERLRAVFRPILQPRVAYGVAMAIFSFSIIINAAGINLRRFTLADLNPRTWAYRANRDGHLLYARVEKFYYDLRVVYETESWLRQLRQQSGSTGQAGHGGSEQDKEAPKPDTPAGGSTDRQVPGNLQLASLGSWIAADRNMARTVANSVRTKGSTSR